MWKRVRVLWLGYFILVRNGSDVGIVPWKELNGATFSRSWFFELTLKWCTLSIKASIQIEIKQRILISLATKPTY